jgi:hypothetical protein
MIPQRQKKYSSVDRNTLSEIELAMLARLELRNSVLVGRGVDYPTRKALLRDYAIEHHQSVVMELVQ